MLGLAFSPFSPLIHFYPAASRSKSSLLTAWVVDRWIPLSFPSQSLKLCRICVNRFMPRQALQHINKGYFLRMAKSWECALALGNREVPYMKFARVYWVYCLQKRHAKTWIWAVDEVAKVAQLATQCFTYVGFKVIFIAQFWESVRMFGWFGLIWSVWLTYLDLRLSTYFELEREHVAILLIA